MKFLIAAIITLNVAQISFSQTSPGTQSKTAVSKPVSSTAKVSEKDTLKPPSGAASVGDFYGEKVRTTRFIDDSPWNDIDKVVEALLKGKKSPEGKITAKIVDVCFRDGCKVSLELKKDSISVYAIMKDSQIHLPLAAKGKKVLIDGEASLKEVSVEELKKEALHLKKAKGVIDAITEPQKQVWLTAKGIIIME